MKHRPWVTVAVCFSFSSLLLQANDTLATVTSQGVTYQLTDDIEMQEL